jgi:cell division cycle 14
LYYCALKSPPSSNKLLLRNRNNEKVPVHCFCMDDELIYWNFFLDFGPLNLGQLYRFTVRLNELLQEGVTILFYSSTAAAKRTNAIYLICAWQLMELNRTPEQAYYGFSFHASEIDDETSTTTDKKKKQLSACSKPPPAPLTSVGHHTIAPLQPFHDASPCACTYELTLMHCLQGLQKARHFKFFDWDTFDVEEYEYFEQVEVRSWTYL